MVPRSRTRRKARINRGNILLETILALLFIVLTVGAVAGLFANSLARVRRSELRTRAMFLAENKLAELQLGLKDMTEGDEGDFNGKPPKFLWKMHFEPLHMLQELSQGQELKRLKITIQYDDPADGFTYSTYRLYSPSLNLSAEKMKEISDDPVKMRAMGGSSEGMENFLSMISEIPGGNKIKEALMRGGVPGMLSLFNKIVGGDITPEDLFEALGEEGKEENSLGAQMVKAGQEDNRPEGWTDYDTAGIGEKPGEGTEVASTDKPRRTGDKPPFNRRPGEGERPPRPGEGRAEPGRGTGDETTPGTDPNTGDQPRSPGTMTREEAIRRMTDMLRRMANNPGKK